MTSALRQQRKEAERREVYLAARKDWKQMHSKDLVSVFRMEVLRQNNLEAKVKVFQGMLDRKLVQVFCQEWCEAMKANLEARKATLAAAAAMEKRHFQAVLKVMLVQWQEAAHGKWSRKDSMERHRRRMERARFTLQERLKSRGEEAGIITKEMLVEESIRSVSARLAKNRRFHKQSQCLHALRNSVLETRESELQSVHHYKLSVMRKAFNPWTEWTYLNSIGLDRARWKAPRKFTVGYNQDAVDGFVGRRVMKLFWRLWVPVAKRFGDAKRMRRRNLSRFANKHLAEWHVVARRQRSLVSLAVAEWRGYASRLTSVPFQMWFVWMDQRKRKRADQQRLLTAYTRTKHRRRLWNILRGWRHQAVFGRIAGLYSRNDLMKSLTEQKHQCKQMENEMNQYIGSVNEMNIMLEANTKRVKEMEINVRKKDDKAKELRLAMHHCEQEMTRMQSYVDSVQKVAPAVSKHLERLQGSEFNFDMRGLTALAKLRKKEEEETGKETVLSKKDVAEEEANSDGGLLLDGADDDGEGDGDDEIVSGGPTMEEEEEGSSLLKSGAAAAVAAAATEEDSAAVKADSARINWVMARADYRTVDLNVLGEDPLLKDREKGGPAEILLLRQGLVNMHALFEFMRTGDASLLSEKERELWAAENFAEDLAAAGAEKTTQENIDGKKMMQGKEEEEKGAGGGGGGERERERERERGEEIEGGGEGKESDLLGASAKEGEHGNGGGGGGDDDKVEPETESPTESSPQRTDVVDRTLPRSPPKLVEPTDRKWKKMTKMTVTGKPYLWKDFVLSLNRKLPTNRKTELTQDKLLTRIQIAKERRENIVKASTLKAQRPPLETWTDLAENVYTGEDFQDESRPVTPPGWKLDPSSGKTG